MPAKKQKNDAPAFRLHRKAVGLTYSCPVDQDDNPITLHEDILDYLTDKYNDNDYIIGKEKHESGKIHWHCYFKFYAAIDSTDPHLFDIKGVHPNICSGSPGKGWMGYCIKDKEFKTNFYKMCAYSTALKLETAQEAIDYLWQERPRDMSLSAHNMIPNLNNHFAPVHEQKRYYGPYPHYFYPGDIVDDEFVHTPFDPDTHSLLLTGPPGIGKTQFARYLLGDCDYVKGSLGQLKGVKYDKPLLFDEINTLTMDPEASKELTDVENGGSFHMRYNDPVIPPGIRRIFCHNLEFPFRNPHEAVYGRRVVSHRIQPFPIVPLPQFVD